MNGVEGVRGCHGKIRSLGFESHSAEPCAPRGLEEGLDEREPCLPHLRGKAVTPFSCVCRAGHGGGPRYVFCEGSRQRAAVHMDPTRHPGFYTSWHVICSTEPQSPHL